MNPPSTLIDFTLRTRLIFGAGALTRLGELARELGSRVILVTDPGLVAAGHADAARAVLHDAGLHVTIFDAVHENPTTTDVDACLAVARDANINLIVGLGGGSAMDTAKGCNFLLTNGGRMADYWGVNKATRAMLPMIAVPTTAGTGSECQSFALIADAVTHQKMACGDHKAAPRIALLDPRLTLTQPPRVTACAGIDAVAHAVEAAVTSARTAVSQMLAREAFRLTHAALPIVATEPHHLAARGDMLLGAALAGMAIESSMLGAAHSAANPLTARFNIVHGQAVGAMLPHVVRFNAADPAVAAEYAALAHTAGLTTLQDNHAAATARLVARLEWLMDQLNLPRRLADLGVSRQAITPMAEEAAAQWTARFNPRPVAAEDFLRLYGNAVE